MEDKLAPYLQEKGCIRLIQCFLNPKLMLCHSESPNSLQEDHSVLELEREGKKIDPLHQLFVQSEHKPIGESVVQCRVLLWALDCYHNVNIDCTCTGNLKVLHSITLCLLVFFLPFLFL